ncbi:hypothetical protein ACMS1Z_14055 [Acidiphilium multivorum]
MMVIGRTDEWLKSSLGAQSGDDERSNRSIVNIDSGDHEHLLALA